MSDIDLSQLPNDSAITGSEQLIANDAGTATDITPNQLADFVVTTKGGQPGGLALFEATNQALATKATLDPVTGKVPASLLDIPSGGGGGTGPAAWLPVAAWAASASYVVGPPASVVTYLGETYVCTSAHTAGSSFDATKFIKIAQKGADGTGGGGGGGTGPAAWLPVAAWAASASYVVGPPASVVTYLGETYVCATAHVAGASFDATKFIKIAQKGADGGGGGGGLVTVVGLTATVAPFRVGAFTHPGGSISLFTGSTSWVGVNIFTKNIHTLPRTGDHGFIPLARVTTSLTAVTDIQPIQPVLPVNRIPRSLSKILSGQTVSGVIMGSSLLTGTGVSPPVGALGQKWAGMLFNEGSKVSDYKVPLPAGSIIKSIAVPGSANVHQGAQLGYATSGTALTRDAGYLTAFSPKLPSGRAANFDAVDFVIEGFLANDCDMKIQLIESNVRNLRKRGIEVIMVTDNPIGATVQASGNFGFGSLAAVQAARYYTDGPEIFKIADIYKCAVVDTAAYMIEAALRYPDKALFLDGIHCTDATETNPLAGRTAVYGNGQEVWARAIRAIFPVDASAADPVQIIPPLSGTGYSAVWSNATLAADSGTGSLILTRSVANLNTFWGIRASVVQGGSYLLPPMAVGDKVRVRGTISQNTANAAFTLGLYSGSPAISALSSPVSTGSFDVTLTVTTAGAAGNFIGMLSTRDSLPQGTTVQISNMTMEYTSVSSAPVAASETVPGRPCESQIPPQSRLVTDLKVPGDTLIILPQDETWVAAADALAGVLETHSLSPDGFAERWSPQIPANKSRLRLDVGKRATFSGYGAVGFGIMYCMDASDTIIPTFNVFVNGTQVGATVPLSVTAAGVREAYMEVITPTVWATAVTNTAAPKMDVVELVVVTGSLRIAAGVFLIAEQDFIPPDMISKVGSWSATRVNGGANMPGYGTDTSGDYALYRSPNTTRRVSWVVSSKPNAKSVDVSTGRNLTTVTNLGGAGNNAVKLLGGFSGLNELHHIKLNVANTATDQATNGYALHVGGAILTLDR